MRDRSSIRRNKRFVDVGTDNSENTTGDKNPAAVALGRLGGLRGGKARALKLSEKERRSIAVKAARARWGSGGTKGDDE